MKLAKIISMANEPFRLRYLAMERSLRATGCRLPIEVIPYDDRLFELPEGSSWRLDEELAAWLSAQGAPPGMRKYQCLMDEAYQFVDADVIFLRDPAAALERFEGFVVCCGHWRDASHAVTEESKEVLRRISTNWQRDLFNTGQFACDRRVYSREELKAACLEHPGTCLRLRYHEQPGLNLLVGRSNVPRRNLTLDPGIESSWAGDYPDDGYESDWREASRKPYLIHWAGLDRRVKLPIDRLFLDYFSEAERLEWLSQAKVASEPALEKLKYLMRRFR